MIDSTCNVGERIHYTCIQICRYLRFRRRPKSPEGNCCTGAVYLQCREAQTSKSAGTGCLEGQKWRHVLHANLPVPEVLKTRNRIYFGKWRPVLCANLPVPEVLKTRNRTYFWKWRPVLYANLPVPEVLKTRHKFLEMQTFLVCNLPGGFEDEF